MRALQALMRVALMNTLQYRSNFLLSFLVGSVTSAAVVFPLVFVFDQAPTVAGWSFAEALLVTGFFQVFAGLVGGIVEPNLGAVVEGVRSGQLDYLLLKPVDAQLAATLTRVDPTRAWDLLGGLVILGYALSVLGAPSVGGVALAVLLLVSGLMAMYGLWLLVICTSFWFVRVDNLRFLLSAVTDAGRWPVNIYTGAARVFLTVVVPVALVTSWPAMALLGRMDLPLAAQALAVGAGLLALSRWTWVKALSYYTSASS